jgi:hypothetical protein
MAEPKRNHRKTLKNLRTNQATEHVLRGDWSHFFHAATETATISIRMIAQMRQWVVAAQVIKIFIFGIFFCRHKNAHKNNVQFKKPKTVKSFSSRPVPDADDCWRVVAAVVVVVVPVVPAASVEAAATSPFFGNARAHVKHQIVKIVTRRRDYGRPESCVILFSI